MQMQVFIKGNNMTHIEFFDSNDIENVCSCIASKPIPDKVYLLCASEKETKVHAERYERLFAQKGADTKFIPRSVNRNDLMQVVSKIEDLISENDDDFAFDLTGGDDLCLVAVGIIAERYKSRKFQLHRYNIETGKMIDCDDDKTTEYHSPVKLTVEENICLFGGKASKTSDDGLLHDQWNFTKEFLSDIAVMWSIMKKSTPTVWNSLSNILQYAAKNSPADDPLAIKSTMTYLKGIASFQNNRLDKNKKNLIQALSQKGYITQYKCDENENVFYIKFRDEQIKRCIMKSGQLMELKVFAVMRSAREKDSSMLFYNDVKTSVDIDWDGKLRTENGDTENEIDVMAMHGIVPVFVSCKNGNVDKHEVYKLNAVAERFGEKYAKKVLITNAKAEDIHSTVIRAKDMGIRVICEFYRMNDSAMEQCVKEFIHKC